MNLAHPAISEALTDLYARADTTPPSVTQCIPPLAALTGAFNLTCTELQELTSRTASDRLLARGALLDPLSGVGDDPLAGFLYADSRYGAVFVERGDRLTRRRFSVAHELGHYVLHFRPVLRAWDHTAETPMVAMDSFPRQTSDDVTPDELPVGHLGLSADATPELPPFEHMEREANQFAVELLMPVPVLWELTDRYRRTFRGDDLVWRLATDMLVSRETMRWRLVGLGLVPPLPRLH